MPGLQRVLRGKDNRAKKGNGKPAIERNKSRRGKHNKARMVDKLRLLNISLKHGRLLRRQVRHYQCSPESRGLHKETGGRESAVPKSKVEVQKTQFEDRTCTRQQDKRKNVISKFILGMKMRSVRAKRKGGIVKKANIAKQKKEKERRQRGKDKGDWGQN